MVLLTMLESLDRPPWQGCFVQSPSQVSPLILLRPYFHLTMEGEAELTFSGSLVGPAEAQLPHPL